MDRSVNPLRYPGSKRQMTEYISGVLEENGVKIDRIHEVFAGGASLSIDLVMRGVAQKAILVEKDVAVAAFWRAVFSDSESLCQKISEVEINIENWSKFSRLYGDIGLGKLPPSGVDGIDLAVCGLFLNRTNYSGILSAGPIGGVSQASNYLIDCRFSKREIINRIQRLGILGPKFEVVEGDGTAYLAAGKSTFNQEDFVFADPPYYAYGRKYYACYFEHDDHLRLRDVLIELSCPWLVTYDAHPTIFEFYKDANINEVKFQYSARRFTQKNELVAGNLEFPRAAYVNGSNCREIVVHLGADLFALGGD